MAKPYPMEIRARVIKAWRSGATRPEIAARFDISLSSVGRYIRRQRDLGHVAPDKFGGYKPVRLADHESLVRGWVASEPDLRLVDMQARLEERGIMVCLSTIFNFLDRLGLSYKKNAARCGAGQTRHKRGA